MHSETFPPSVANYAEIIMQNDPDKTSEVTQILLDKMHGATHDQDVVKYARIIIQNNPDKTSEVIQILLDKMKNETRHPIVIDYAEIIMQNNPDKRADILRILLTKEQIGEIDSKIIKLLNTYEDDCLIPEDIAKAAAHIYPALSHQLFTTVFRLTNSVPI